MTNKLFPGLVPDETGTPRPPVTERARRLGLEIDTVAQYANLRDGALVAPTRRLPWLRLAIVAVTVALAVWWAI